MEGLVEVLSVFIAIFVNFFGQLVERLEAIFSPSAWQGACIFIVDTLIGLVGSFVGEPRRLSVTMLLVSCISHYNSPKPTHKNVRHLLELVH